MRAPSEPGRRRKEVAAPIGTPGRSGEVVTGTRNEKAFP